MPTTRLFSLPAGTTCIPCRRHRAFTAASAIAGDVTATIGRTCFPGTLQFDAIFLSCFTTIAIIPVVRHFAISIVVPDFHCDDCSCRPYDDTAAVATAAGGGSDLFPRYSLFIVVTFSFIVDILTICWYCCAIDVLRVVFSCLQYSFIQWRILLVIICCVFAFIHFDTGILFILSVWWNTLFWYLTFVVVFTYTIRLQLCISALFYLPFSGHSTIVGGTLLLHGTLLYLLLLPVILLRCFLSQLHYCSFHAFWFSMVFCCCCLLNLLPVVLDLWPTFISVVGWWLFDLSVVLLFSDLWASCSHCSSFAGWNIHDKRSLQARNFICWSIQAYCALCFARRDNAYDALRATFSMRWRRPGAFICRALPTPRDKRRHAGRACDARRTAGLYSAVTLLA